MDAQKFWEIYAQKENVTAEYDAWAFGDDPNTLAQLVLDGTKTATASAYCLYELAGEELPKAGEYSVILNTQGEPVCIIRTEKVFVVPFCEVDEKQAWKEGEGNRSLPYWRQVHKRFFQNELAVVCKEFDENMLVVCEEFLRVYP